MSVEKAAKAGLFHDVSRYFPKKRNSFSKREYSVVADYLSDVCLDRLFVKHLFKTSCISHVFGIALANSPRGQKKQPPKRESCKVKLLLMHITRQTLGRKNHAKTLRTGRSCRICRKSCSPVSLLGLIWGALRR